MAETRSKHKVGDIELELFEGTVDDLIAEQQELARATEQAAAALPALPLDDPRTEAIVRLSARIAGENGVRPLPWIGPEASWMLAALAASQERSDRGKLLGRKKRRRAFEERRLQVAAMALGADSETRATLEESWGNLRRAYATEGRLPAALCKIDYAHPVAAAAVEQEGQRIAAERQVAAEKAAGIRKDEEGLEEIGDAVTKRR